LLRLYVEPHLADIDVHVFNQTSGRPEAIARSIKFFDEEAVLLQLTPGSYSVKFVTILPWKGQGVGAFGMQMGIASLDQLAPSPSPCVQKPPPALVLHDGRAEMQQMDLYIDPEHAFKDSTVCCLL